MDPQVTLDICYDVRRRLHENGVEILSLDFPIEEMKAKGVMEDSHYLGYCHSTHDDWELIDETHKIARVHAVQSVEICLQDPNTKEIYTLERILPTLLHEFAHCITPGLLVYGHDENGKHKRKWNYDSHGDAFYTNMDMTKMENIRENGTTIHTEMPSTPASPSSSTWPRSSGSTSCPRDFRKTIKFRCADSTTWT